MTTHHIHLVVNPTRKGEQNHAKSIAEQFAPNCQDFIKNSEKAAALFALKIEFEEFLRSQAIDLSAPTPEAFQHIITAMSKLPTEKRDLYAKLLTSQGMPGSEDGGAEFFNMLDQYMQSSEKQDIHNFQEENRPVIIPKVTVVKNIKETLQNIKAAPDDKHYLLGIDEYGLKAFQEHSRELEELQSQAPALRFIWSGHKYFPGLYDIVKKMSSLYICLDKNALPKPNTLFEKLLHSARNPEEKRRLQECFNFAKFFHAPMTPGKPARVIKRTGVPVMVTEEELEEAASFVQDLLGHSTREKLVLVLGGDTVTEQGQRKYFTPAEARGIAGAIVKKISALEELPEIIVCNSPRTGSYDPKTGAKRKDIHQADVADPTTDAVMSVFREEGLDATLFNFNPGDKDSRKKLLGSLYLADHSPYVTGDSMSMISETVAVMGLADKKTVNIISTESTQLAHLKQIYSFVQRGDVRALAVDADRERFVVSIEEQDKKSVQEPTVWHYLLMQEGLDEVKTYMESLKTFMESIQPPASEIEPDTAESSKPAMTPGLDLHKANKANHNSPEEPVAEEKEDEYDPWGAIAP